MSSHILNSGPHEILNVLLDGNLKYSKGVYDQRDPDSERKLSQSPQEPKAVIVSCLDSRVPVEQLFNQGVGDLFVSRIAGNISNDDVIGSLEFATKLAGSKVIMVLGHTSCGAVKGACANAELGKLTQLLEKIKPVAELARQSFSGDTSEDNPEFLNYVAELNAIHTLNQIRKGSSVIEDLEKEGEILLVAGIYDLETQRVRILTQ